MQNSFYAIYYQRMPGIVTTLKTNHGIRLFGEEIYNLTLAFVTPLGTYYYNCFCHLNPSAAIHLRPPSHRPVEPVFCYIVDLQAYSNCH